MPELPTVSHAAERAALTCRVIALDGEAGAEVGPLLVGVGVGVGVGRRGPSPPELATPIRLDQGMPPDWVSLGKAARLVAKDPRTTRETTFLGPGRVRDCVGAAEEAWVADGSFESTAGAGEAPGAEEWVVTPHTVVRYAAAKLRLDVRSTGTKATIVAGVAFMWPPATRVPDRLDEGWQRLGAGDTTAPASGSARDALDRCGALALRSHDLTAALLSRGSDGGVDAGAAVRDQVTTRRLARAACALAGLRVDAEAPPDGSDSGTAAEALALEWAQADATWRALPVAPATR